ncbi:MAG: ABC transporter ATP-binding protein [Planctomycetes bacterium]|nr:ABC transporter ATP-binding protein [Planctomycetota bacterium]
MKDRNGQPRRGGRRGKRRVEDEEQILGLDEQDAADLAGGKKAIGWKERLQRLANPVSREDRRVYKRMVGYIRPYLGRILVSAFFAAVGGSLVAANLAILDSVLEALSPEPTAQSEPARLDGTAPAPQPDADPTPPAAAPGGAAPAGTETRDAGKKDAGKEKDGERKPLISTGNARQDLNLSVLILLGLALFGSLCKYIEAVIMAAVSRRVIRNLREDCFKQLVRLPLRFHMKTHSGNILSRIIKDIEKLKILLISLSMSGVKEIFAFAAILFIIIWKTSWIAPFALLFLILVFIPIRLVADKLRHRDREAEAGTADIFAIVSEALANQKVLKSFTAEKYEIKRFKHATRSVYKRQVVTYRLRSVTEPIVDIVSGVAVAGCIWYLGHEVLDQDIKIGALAVVIVALQRLTASSRKLGKMQNDFVRGITAAGRVSALLEQKPEIKEAPDAVPLEDFRQAIEFRAVTFEYEKDCPVLKEVSFTVGKGETVALVGPSGAGKTSLVDLLPRFYDVDQGHILIDGRDVREYTLKSLRKCIGAVTQETQLFRDSIRENIAYGLKSVREEAVVAAARAASAHQFIIAKPKGYDTPLGERGGRLSGGERQRIAIARALLKNPPILILDEATSSLDAESEAQVQHALNRLMDGRTTLVIAHRLSTIRRADRIIVLEDGRVAESGTHDQLMALNGRYARAYNLQVDALARGELDATLDDFFGEEQE